MSTARWMQSITAFFRNPWVRVTLLCAYYLAILLGLVLMYGQGELAAPEFVYQGF